MVAFFLLARRAVAVSGEDSDPLSADLGLLARDAHRTGEGERSWLVANEVGVRTESAIFF